MKYHFPIPLSALIVYFLVFLGIRTGVLPAPDMIIDWLRSLDGWVLFFGLFLVILLESIIYLGFYFPGQLLAVLVIVLYDFTLLNLILLTVVCIVAVIISAAINYYLGWYLLPHYAKEKRKVHYKELLPAMLHINILALYVFEQGGRGTDRKLIPLTGLVNLPYYALLISMTFLLQDYLIELGQNPYILGGLLLLWLVGALYVDRKRLYAHIKSISS